MIAAEPPTPGIAWALGAFVVATVAERVMELLLSARHVRRLAARGAIEFDRGHYPVLVALHALYPIALIGEVLWLGARPNALWPLWLALWLGAHALRAAAMRSLGERWTTRIWVLPGAALVNTGPYRLLRHPNYAAVVAELLAGPLVFGAWRTAAVISLINALALGVRIRAENAALESASAGLG